MIFKLIELLSRRAYSFSELMVECNIKDRHILIRYLDKIKKLSKKKGWKFIIIPARCKSCGYIFKEDIKPPSKCPRCKSEWIAEPKFYIEI